MEKFNMLLNQLRVLGLDIKDNNVNVECTTPYAEVFYQTHELDKSTYILGEIHGSTEDLKGAVYDVMFHTIEQYYTRLSKDEYNKFHHMALSFPSQYFLKYLDILDHMHPDENVYSDMADCIRDWLENMCGEVEKIIDEIKAIKGESK